jgi:hypothetical protein
MSAENGASELIKQKCRGCPYIDFNGRIYGCIVQYPETVIKRLKTGFGCYAAATEVRGTKNLIPGVMTTLGFRSLGDEVDALEHITNLKEDENGILRFKK